MVMVPIDYQRFIEVMVRATSAGLISMQRIDDAVRRILTAKSTLAPTEPGFDTPPLSVVGSQEHRDLAAEAVRRSAVLLKNDGALPLPPGTRSIEVAGQAADDIGLQCGGWTVGWQGGSGKTTPGTTLLDGLGAVPTWDVEYDPDGRFPGRDGSKVGIVCIAEPPYAEGPGDSAEPTVSEEDRAVFARVRDRTDILILVIYSGRPLVIPDLIARADAVVAAWLPGTEGAALADLLTGLRPFEARTPQPWQLSFAALGDPVAAPLYAAGHRFELSPRAATSQGLPGVRR
jgi:beta-glucosidase